MATYELVIRKPKGELVCTLCDTDFSLLSITLKDNTPGKLKLRVPSDVACDLDEDYRIEVWRKVDADCPAYLEGETAFLVDKVDRTSLIGTIEIEAESALGLLKRHIVAYAPDTAQTDKAAAPLDDLVKAIVAENSGVVATGSETTAAPDPMRYWFPYLVVAANAGAWANKPINNIERKTLLDVASEAAKLSEFNGIHAFFDVVQIDHNGGVPAFEFRTWINQRGADHGCTSTDPLEVSEDNSTLTQAHLVANWQGSANRVYAGRSGSTTIKVEDAGLAAAYADDPFVLREAWKAAASGATATDQQSDAEKELAQRTATRQLEAVLTSSACKRYGCDFYFGDKLCGISNNQAIDVHVSPLTITVESGKESIKADVSESANVGVSELTGLMKALADLQRQIREMQART